MDQSASNGILLKIVSNKKLYNDHWKLKKEADPKSAV